MLSYTTIFLTLLVASSIIPYSLVYAFDDVLTNGEFNYTKAWELTKSTNRSIECDTLFYDPVVESLERSYDNLSDIYGPLVEKWNNYTLSFPYDDDNLTRKNYYDDLYTSLDPMKIKLDQLRNEINNRTDFEQEFRVSQNCAGFNMAYELQKGFAEANRTYTP